MNKEQIIDYLYKCSELDVPPMIAFSVLCKHAGLVKTADMFKQSLFWIPFLLGAGGGATAPLWWNKVFGSSPDPIKNIQQQEIASNTSLAGTVGGATLGAIYGPEFFPDYSPSAARLLGIGTGALGGGVGGYLLGNLMGYSS